MSQVETRLKELGIELPEAPAPVANYVPYAIAGKLVFVSGQGPMRDGKLATIGKLGGEVSLEDGVAAARDCAISLLAQAKAAAGGDLDNIARCVKLLGLVNSTPDFTEQPKVINGASDLLVEVLGDAGRHARSAVGAPALPFDMAVEIEAIFELK
jgi:enamine deaminase RidA (YjgF/YER057c/UK114 family)